MSAEAGAVIAGVFDRAAPHYDRSVPFFGELAADLVRWSPPPAGARVLDLGAGAGACLRALAGWDTGPVVGVDISPEMLRRAAAAAPPGTYLVQADIHRLPFRPGAFDMVYCALAWQLLYDPAAVLARLRTIGSPGTVLACSLLGRSRHSWHFMSEVLADYLGTRQPPFAVALQAAGRVPPERVLADAGWGVTERHELVRQIEFGTTAQWLTWQLAQVGRGYFDEVSAAVRPAMYERLCAAAERVRVQRGLRLEQWVTFLRATPAR